MSVLYDKHEQIYCWYCKGITSHTKVSVEEDALWPLDEVTPKLGTAMHVLFKVLDHKTLGLVSMVPEAVAKLRGKDWRYKCDICGMSSR